MSRFSLRPSGAPAAHRHRPRHRRRTALALTGAAALVASLAAVVLPGATGAAPGWLTGAVVLDTNADGTAGSSADAGRNEPGFGGVTIQLVCVGGAQDGAVLGTTTSGPDGNYVFDPAPSATACASEQVAVRATVTDNRYSISDGTVGTDNMTPRAGTPQIGLSAPFATTSPTATSVLTLVRPDWEVGVVIPTTGGNPNVTTGSTPLDSGCPEPGKDCSLTDLVVRNQDVVSFEYAVSASSHENLSPTLSDVVLEVTLDLDPDGPGGMPASVVNFDRVPARCKSPASNGTAPPASRIIAQPGGAVVPEGTFAPAGTTSVTLICNLGVWSATGDAVTLTPVVKVSGQSAQGTQFDSSARAYAVDDNLLPTAVPTADVDYGPIDITAAPAYELEKKGFFNQDLATRDIGNGTETGFYTYSVIQIKTNRKTGVEALQQPITITEDLFGFKGDGVTAYDLRFAITECIPNTSLFLGTVGGKQAPYGAFVPVNQTVPDSGTCTVARNDSSDPTSDYTLTFNGIDMTGARFPTQTYGGSDLTPGPFYVASYRVQIFIPYSEIDAADGTIGDNRGSLVLYNRIGDFDPNGLSGASNFGPEVEDGYCDEDSVDGHNLNDPGMPFCDEMPDGSRSDNVIGPKSYQFSPGSFAKYLLDQLTMYSNNYHYLPGQTAAHDGAAVLQPGQIADTHLNWINQGVPDGWTNSRICDVFDNTMLKLVPSSATVSGGSNSIYAWLSASGPGTGDYNAAQEAAYNAKWIFEFGHIAIDYDTDGPGPDTGDDPIASAGPNPTTARYDGTWTDLASKRCEDSAAAGGWFTDPNSVPGGIDAVNAVRVRPGIDPDTGQETRQAFGVNNRLNFGMQVRDTFNGGAHPSMTIPTGAVAANFGAVRADQENNGAWSARNYKPSPESTNGDGDRITVARASLAIQKRTITVDGVGDGPADFGQTGHAVAGNPIVWEVVASVSADSLNPAPVTNLRITDVLPAHAEYDADCTASIAGGTPADEVQLNTPSAGRTTLIWNLGTWTPNTAIPNRRVCTLSDPLAPNGTELPNHSEVTYDGAPSHPFDDHTVTLEQTGAVKLRKTVDVPLDLLNDDQLYTLSAQNFSDRNTVAAPTIIEVFPYNGDGTPLGGANRNPPSSFSGTLRLTAAPTLTTIGGAPYSGQFLYTADAPSTINQNPAANTSTWCTEAGGTFTLVSGAGTCPTSFAGVTGLKMIGRSDLSPITTPATSGLTIAFTLQAGDPANPLSAAANKPGDVYSNRFTMSSATFTDLTLASNRVVVRTVAHSVGDWIFEDRDGDGKYTPGRDLPAPNAQVNLWAVPASGPAVLIDTTTSEDGRYLFDLLPAGRYYVEIPASQFAAGGPLAGFSLTPAPAAGTSSDQVEQNDDVSHDAVAGSGTAVRSNQFTLSATKDPVTGAVSGDEPTGESIHGIVDPTTTDAFSNMAIDLALARQPAIDIEKEICTLADNSCDPAAALGSGGWSVDGVPGNGPASEVATKPVGADALWRIIVTNTGQQYLSGVAVTDPVEPACARTSATIPAFADFAPGAQQVWVCTTTGLTHSIRPNTAVVVATPPGDQPPVTDTDTANVVVTTSITLRKAIVDPAPQDTAGDAATFPVTVSCVSPAGGAPMVRTVELNRDGTVVTVEGIEVGSTCTITETDTDGGTATISPSGIVVATASPVAVTVTNTYTAMTITKTVQGAVNNPDGTVTVTYRVTATNTGAVPGTYSLVDALAYSPQLAVVSATVVSATTGVTANSGWNGATSTTIVHDQTIAGGAAHVFVVTVVGRPSTTFTGDTADCTLTAGETGTGALNTAALTFAGTTTTAAACVPPGDITVMSEPPVKKLAITGADVRTATWWGLLLLVLGLGLTTVRRRRA